MAPMVARRWVTSAVRAPSARRSRSRLGAGMAAADHDHVEGLLEAHVLQLTSLATNPECVNQMRRSIERWRFT